MRRGRTPIHSVSYRKAPPLGSVRIYSVLESENRHGPAKTLDADAVCEGKKTKSKRMGCGGDVRQILVPRAQRAKPASGSSISTAL